MITSIHLYRFKTQHKHLKYTSHFMDSNPLVFEYFEGKYPKHTEEASLAIRKSKL